MKTINIWFNADATPKDMWHTIVSIYDKFLCNDDLWHFFWEGPFIHIRCEEEFAASVVEFVINLPTVNEVEDPREWVDDQEIVNKYRWYFERQFHNNSMLAIEMYTEGDWEERLPNFVELYYIYDRLAHCIVNSWFYIGKNAARENRLDCLELALASHYSTQRARFFGRWEYNMELYNERIKRASEEGTDGSDS